MTAYYNEHDPKAAACLRELISRGLIAPGDVDERSVEDVVPTELAGYAQCHFFAGIGVWSYALRLAGWPDDRPVWTGSCPCQPFSAAGERNGFADERHLWPAWFHLISQCKPNAIFGEQVASRDAGPWLDLVHDDLEALGYAVGPIVLPAAGLGAPHGRHRIYFVADAEGQRRWANIRAIRKSQDQGLRSEKRENPRRPGERAGRVGDLGPTGGVADAGDRPGPTNGFWRDADWLRCTDEKWRPVRPGAFPLVDGAAARVVRLRGYGNAIPAPVAEAFIIAYLYDDDQPNQEKP